jgi:oxygen-independent coproporphyrinogen-3 oxidase
MARIDIPAALVRRYEGAGPRYTSYPPANRWSEDVDADLHARALQAAGVRAPDAPLSLYVHLPFCRSLCFYCGCNVVVASRVEAADPYLDDLEQEIALVAAHLGPRRRVSQLHWGGGTPTFLDEPRLERLFRALERHFVIEPGAEVAIEIDPRVTRPAQLALLRRLGFNRLSLGVQDFAQDVQRAIGRRQSRERTAAVAHQARAFGYAGMNFDLVYGLPHQTADTWAETLDTAIALGPDRFAIYSFAYVPALRPAQRRLPLAEMATGPAKLALLLQAHERLEAAGYVAIGMDHFARASDELAVAQRRGDLHRNFQGYTVKSAEDVVAFGATAISDLGGGLYAQNHRELARYHAAIASGRLATVRGAALTDDDRRRRAVIAALMCNLQVALDAEAQAYFAPELEALAPLERDGLVRVSGGVVSVTPVGRFFVRNVAMAFDAATAATSGLAAAATV